MPSTRAEAHRGLSSQEARRRLARDGPNEVVPEARASRLRRLVGPLADPMVLLLLVAAPTYALIGERRDAVVACVALVPVAAVGWLLESRAEHTLDRLRRLTAPTALVVRDGQRCVLNAQDVVVGDVVWVQEGGVVPADGRVIELTQLLVDESALTGESVPVSKQAAAEVFAGTTVVSGRAMFEVTATGAATRYGRVGSLVASLRPPATPLQHALGRLVRALAVVAALFCIAVIASELAHGHGVGAALIAGVSLAMAAIPEEFSVVYTLYLAMGAWRLSRRRALVRRLPSVETLGSTTVICTDKTGTLTHGRLAVTALWSAPDQPLPAEDHALLEAAVRACEPEPFDPLDVAIVDAARGRGVDVDALHEAQLVADWPFDPAQKYLTHLWRTASGAHAVAAKGAFEGVVRHSSADDAYRAAAEGAHEAFVARGMRVIAVAGGTASGASGERAVDETDLRFLGLIAFSDPVRDGVAEALATCRAAGVRVIMITGDHPGTAHAVAETLLLPHTQDGADLIVTGEDLDAAQPARQESLAGAANVFARIRPEQKHWLVQALRRRGEVVAMTGDGVNDAPALRDADIGIAMGDRGTDVARESAALVLLDDNFATIVAAVHDGRRIFDNLTRAFAYLIAFHPPLLFAALVVPVIGRPLLLLPIHLVVLELLLHPIVSLVFQADPADADVMDRPPRPVADALRLRSLWRPYAVGLTVAVGVLGCYLAALHAGWPFEQARGFGFAVLLACQPFLLLGMRSPDAPWWTFNRRWTGTLTAVVVVLAAVTAASVSFAPLTGLLQQRGFALRYWVVVIGVALVTTSWAELLKASGRARVRAARP